MESRPAACLGTLAAVAALASSAPVQGEGVLARGPTWGEARARIELRIEVPQILHLKMLRREPAVEVSALPGGTSVASVQDAVEFEVLSNSREYGIRFEVLDEQVTSIEVEGMDVPLHLGPDGAVHHVPNRTATGHRPKRHVLGYRIHYAPGTAPGTRPSPVHISAQAL